MQQPTLTTAQRRRLERLARDAGRTPAAMLRFVLRDGFDYCEREVRESIAAEIGAKQHGYVAHAQVQREVRDIITAAHATKRRKAA